MNGNDIFTIKVRKCKRCGRLLTSEKAVKRGYGDHCRCIEKKEQEEREPIPGQMNIFDFESTMNEQDEERKENEGNKEQQKH